MDVTFYATLDASTLKPYLPDIPFLLPLASWWRQDLQLKRPPRVPSQLSHVAVDCGSYTLAQRQVEPGYHFSAQQYTDWIAALGPSVRWAVLPDWPCEGASTQEVRRRQIATTDTALEVLSAHVDVGWCWTPVLQGQTVEDYLRHAIDIADWVYELQDVYVARGRADDFRVCLGSLCRRDGVADIRAIVSNVATVLPGVNLHLFGVKLQVLRQAGYLPDAVASLDSAAWTSRFGQGIDRSVDEQQRTCVPCQIVIPNLPGRRPKTCSRCGGPLGARQREYTLLVALPRYRARVERALLARGQALDDRIDGTSARLPRLRQTRLPWASDAGRVAA
jgi:hypothetical protein